jgi:hypothetical protein
MLDAATGKFDQGLQLQDYAAESRVKEKLYKLRRSTAAWHSQSQSAIRISTWDPLQQSKHSTTKARGLFGKHPRLRAPADM